MRKQCKAIVISYEKYYLKIQSLVPARTPDPLLGWRVEQFIYNFYPTPVVKVLGYIGNMSFFESFYMRRASKSGTS